MQFWFDFASPYSHLAAQRIEPLAEAAGVEVTWRPFLLGPIFKDQGWDNSPFILYPAKGKYMWRDVERRGQKYGIPMPVPAPDDPRTFPLYSVTAARMAVAAMDHPWGVAFCKAVFLAGHGGTKDIRDRAVLSEIATSVGGPSDLLDQAMAPEVKGRVRAAVEEARGLGIFGAPTFSIGTELFWGEDQLEDALSWAKST